MRFHLFGLAHVPVRFDECICPFTTLTYDMARMIKANGHELILYGAAGPDAPCDEFVELVSAAPLEVQAPPAGGSIFRIPEGGRLETPPWQEFVRRGRAAFAARHRPSD